MESSTNVEFLSGTFKPYTLSVTVASGTVPGFICTTPSEVTGGIVQLTFECDGFDVVTGLPKQTTSSGFAPLIPSPDIMGGGMWQGDYTVTVFFSPIKNALCQVTGEAQVDFTADSEPHAADTLVATGDSILCIVEEGDVAGEPRLDMELGNPNPPRCGAGVQRLTTIIVTNNDLTNGVTFDFEAENHQNARLPTTVGGSGGLSAISSVGSGDDFPFVFAEDCPASGIVPLPTDPMGYINRPISKSVTLAPGEAITIGVANNSHPLCSDGSCIEARFTAVGQFSNGDAALSCVGGSLNLQRSSDCPDATFPAACCFGNGSCLDLKPFDCVAQGGSPGDAYSNCQGDVSVVNGIDDACEVDPADRTFVPQACCTPFEPCEMLDPRVCAAKHSTPQLPTNSCSPTLCPNLVNCCFADGECQIMLESVCNSTLGSGVETWLRFQDETTGVFVPTASATVGYNVYRGSLPIIPANGYGSCFQQIAAAGPLAFNDFDPLSPGQGFFYLVALDGASGETGLGRSSTGQQRIPTIACP